MIYIASKPLAFVSNSTIHIQPGCLYLAKYELTVCPTIYSQSKYITNIQYSLVSGTEKPIITPAKIADCIKIL